MHRLGLEALPLELELEMLSRLEESKILQLELELEMPWLD